MSDAWCHASERKLVAPGADSSNEWFKEADFKIVCASCWDHAQQVCGGFTGWTSQNFDQPECSDSNTHEYSGRRLHLTKPLAWAITDITK